MALRILVLAEGDPETHDSWSGSSRGLIHALRDRGHTVTGVDVSERGLARWNALALSFNWPRHRWVARFHFGRPGFAARTAAARRAVAARARDVDVVLQIGATFDALGTGMKPGCVYCDSNVRVAARNAPFGDVAALTPREQDAVASRERRIYDAAAAVFTMSEYVRQSFLQDFALGPDRAVTVYGGANLDVESMAPRLAPPEGPPTVLFVGRHWIPKGGPLLLEAFQQARAVVPNARLLVVGCTPPITDVPGVEVIGPVAKSEAGGEARLSALYRQADVFCMPTRFDAFGLVFVEAMLHNVACLGTARAAIPEIIEDGNTGWVVPEGDAAALRDRLIAAFRDRAGLMAMGLRGRARALERFTWPGVVRRMEPALTRAAGLR